MDKFFTVFMAFAMLICLFAILVILRDIIRESFGSKKKQKEQYENNARYENEQPKPSQESTAKLVVSVEPPVQPAPPVQPVQYVQPVQFIQPYQMQPVLQPAPMPVEQPKPVEEPVKPEVVEEPKPVEEPAPEVVEEPKPAEEPVVENETVSNETAVSAIGEQPAESEDKPVEIEQPAESETLPEGSVSFVPAKALTLQEKYDNLESKYQTFYNRISDYAAKIPNVKHFKNNRYEEYKLGQASLVRLLIKKGVVVCEFVLTNQDFKNYITENKVAIKQAGSSLKILNMESVRVAKDSIDIAVKVYEEERALRKQLVREQLNANHANNK